MRPKKSDKCIFFSKRTKNFTDFTKNNDKQAFAGRKKFRHLLFFEKSCWNSVIKFLILFFGKKNLQKLQLLESKKNIQTGNALFWSSVIFFCRNRWKNIKIFTKKLPKNWFKTFSKFSHKNNLTFWKQNIWNGLETAFFVSGQEFWELFAKKKHLLGKFSQVHPAFFVKFD